MGFDSTVVLAQVLAPLPGTVEARAYPEVTIEMPRWGWLWARDRHELTLGQQKYRLVTDTTPEGVTQDAYGAPLQALDVEAFLGYINTEQQDSLSLPAVAALLGLLESLRKGDWGSEYVVLCVGH